MLATTTTPPPPYRVTTTFHEFLPAIPSPLSPRSANIHGPSNVISSRGTFFMSSSEAESDISKSNKDAKDIPFSKRAVKKAPSPKQDELKERRRSMFLKKVRDGREERRFEARGDDMMRLDFVRRRKQWEAQLAREAPFIPSDFPDYDDEEQEKEEEAAAYDLPTSSSNAMQISAPSTQQPPTPTTTTTMMMPEYEVDEVEQREREELEALLSYYTPVGHDDGGGGGEGVGEEELSEHLYSDDDDYDALFEEIIALDAQQEGGMQQQQQQQQHQQHQQQVVGVQDGGYDGDEMDMS